MTKRRTGGYIHRNIMKAYNEIGKEAVTVAQLREQNRILKDRFSDVHLANVLEGMNWVLVEKIDSIGMTGSKNKISLWKPPENYINRQKDNE